MISYFGENDLTKLFKICLSIDGRIDDNKNEQK